MLCSEPDTSLVHIRAQHTRLLNLFYSYIYEDGDLIGLRMRAKRKPFTSLILETASGSDTDTKERRSARRKERQESISVRNTESGFESQFCLIPGL